MAVEHETEFNRDHLIRQGGRIKDGSCFFCGVKAAEHHHDACPVTRSRKALMQSAIDEAAGEIRKNVQSNVEKTAEEVCENARRRIRDAIRELPGDLVNHPEHYNSHPAGIECIDVVEHMSFNIGNVVKYLWRMEHKNGLEDLDKALWYLKRERQRLTGEPTED